MEKKINIENQIKRLDEIISKISSSNVDIDESLALYEEGQKIIKDLTKLIEEAKEKVEKVIE